MRGTRNVPTIDSMDHDRALTSLPRTYRVALALRDLGADEALIADCLDVEPSAVAPLLEIGLRKQRRLGLLDERPEPGQPAPDELGRGR